jgi:hypothetical protein
MENFFRTHTLFRGKRNPPIVLDFSFHPGAAFWFDHHATAFKNDKWKKKFKQSKFYQWKPDYSSCCHLVVDSLKKNFDYRPPMHIKELAKWLDVIDAAHYVSAKQTIEKKEPALQLEIYIEEDIHTIKENKDFIEAITKRSLESIANDVAVRKSVQKYHSEAKIGLAYYKSNSKIYGTIGVVTLPPNKFKLLRFAPFYIWPNLLYAVRVTKKNKLFTLSLGINPWRQRKNNIHIGEFLKKHFPGSGGHKNVGGAEFRTKKEVESAIIEIVKEFNTKS